MNSNLIKKVTTLTYSTLLILAIGLLFSFSHSEKPSNKEDFLSITVDYKIDFQLIKITEGTLSFKKIAILHPDNNRALLLKWLNKKDYVIVRRELSDIMDNQYIFELLQQYKVKGWKLNSHNFGIGKSIDEDCQISFYLFTK